LIFWEIDNGLERRSNSGISGRAVDVPAGLEADASGEFYSLSRGFMNPELTAKDIEQHRAELIKEQLSTGPVTNIEYWSQVSVRTEMVGRFAKTFGGDK
jgi:hypothetical protein